MKMLKVESLGQITGAQAVTPDSRTDQWGIGATDLGYVAPCWFHDNLDACRVRDVSKSNYTITVFGDTFADHVGGADHRSPVGLRQSNRDLNVKIKWDNAIGGAHAKQMIEYEHGGTPEAGLLPDGFTNIPCDLIQLPNGEFLMSTFAIKSWNPESLGGSWTTYHSRLWISRQEHGEDWDRTNFDFPNDGSEWSHFQNNSMLILPAEGDQQYLYIYGTNEGRWKGGGIHLMRVPVDKIFDRSAYRFWGDRGNGYWDWGATSTPILRPAGKNGIGEINAQIIDGKVVLAWCEFGEGATASVKFAVAPRPEGLWEVYNTDLNNIVLPNLYAPTIHPYSHLDDLHFYVSQWSTSVVNVALERLNKPPKRELDLYRTLHFKTRLM
ncbi:MAG: DUF4185 domain-containing protein [Corynebacterium sp.]|nr:DUF4185 domain-containing protein [Corynebacterium sp.]